MKILMCGDYPDPLTTIAPGVESNALRAAALGSEGSPGLPEIPSPVSHERPATIPAS